MEYEAFLGQPMRCCIRANAMPCKAMQYKAGQGNAAMSWVCRVRCDTAGWGDHHGSVRLCEEANQKHVVASAGA